MKLIRNAFVAGTVAATMTVAACSSHQVGSTGTNTNSGNGGNVGSLANSGQDNVGKVSAALDLAPGIQLQSLSWTISNGTHTYGPTTLTIGDAQSVEWVAGGIAAGSGYTVSVSATAGPAMCSGTSGMFAVQSGQVTQVVMAIVCTVPTDASVATDTGLGSVEVDASVTLNSQGALVCPGITSFSASPAEVLVGQPSQLAVMTTDSGAIVTWSVSPTTGGTFSSTTGLTTSFQCAAPNTQVTVTATASLADSGLCAGQAFTTMSALINCESGTPSCSASDPAHPNSCTLADGGTACVNFSNDANNCGSCGHVCPTATPTCSGGTCVTVPVTACTSSPCATSGANSAQCSDKTNGVCTSTEAIVMNYDIAKNSQGSGAAVATGCYKCMINNACLDATGTANGLGTAVTNAECGDPDGANTNPPFDSRNVSASNVPNCLDALLCTITGGVTGTAPYSSLTDCTTSQSPSSVSNCYCGSATGSACIASPSAPVGVCASRENTALGTTDPTTALSHFTDSSFSPGGVGNAVLNCALTANCTACFH